MASKICSRNPQLPTFF